MASATATDNATVLAFDFGTRRIGVAVGNSITGVARPLPTIASDANATRFAAIAALIEEWRPDVLVVGPPGARRRHAARDDRARASASRASSKAASD